MSEINTRKRGKKWEYRFEGAKIDGKRKQYGRGGFATKKEALEAGAKAYTEYNQAGQYVVPSEMSVTDYLDYWMTNYCKVNLKPTTIGNYAKKIKNHIIPVIGQYKLRAVTPSVLQSLINQKFNEGYSRNTLSTLKGILTNSFSYAVEPCRFLKQSPMYGVKLPSPRAQAETPTRRKEKSIVTPEQWKKIIERFPYDNNCTAHIPLQFGYRCGLRLGETFGLTWDDVDFKAAKLTIAKQIQHNGADWYYTPPKYNSVRTIDLDDAMLELLRSELERQQKARQEYSELYAHLFIDDNNVINTKEGKEIYPICRRENGNYLQPRIMQHVGRVIHYELNIKDYDYHSLRHTHATNLIQAGANLKYTQERLGHKNIEVTLNIYAHVTEKLRKEQKQILNQI